MTAIEKSATERLIEAFDAKDVDGARGAILDGANVNFYINSRPLWVELMGLWGNSVEQGKLMELVAKRAANVDGLWKKSLGMLMRPHQPIIGKTEAPKEPHSVPDRIGMWMHLC